MNSAKDPRRRFTNRQARILYLSSDDKCSICGNPLPVDWQVDHIIPHSADGQTTIENGQIVCPDCNRKKGAKMPDQIPMFSISGYKPNIARPIVPRNWQTRFAEQVLNKYQTGEQNFLCESVPAGGKTYGSLLVAKMMFEQHIVEQLIVVAPTDYLRDQWIRKAWEMTGFSLKQIEVDPRTGKLALTEDYCGVVTTYAQVSTNIDRLFSLGRHKRTLVIFDEVHHCGEEKNWGSGVIAAFWKDGADKLFYRLSVSGTPFRTDNDRIPFVDYERKYIDKSDGTLDVQWVSRPDFSYKYLDALMDDEVVREVTFRMEKGKFSWKSNIGDF